MRQYFDATSKRLATAGFSNIDELQVFRKANHIYNKYFQKFIKLNYSAKQIIFQKLTIAITVKQLNMCDIFKIQIETYCLSLENM